MDTRITENSSIHSVDNRVETQDYAECDTSGLRSDIPDSDEEITLTYIENQFWR
jgi:hypothetical protein